MDAFTNRAREKFPLREKGDKRRGAERRPEFLMLSGASAPFAAGDDGEFHIAVHIIGTCHKFYPGLPPSLRRTDGRTDGNPSAAASNSRCNKGRMF